MGSGGSISVCHSPSQSCSVSSPAATKDPFFCGTKIVNKYNVVACVIYRLVLLVKACYHKCEEQVMNPNIVLSLKYSLLKVINPPTACTFRTCGKKPKLGCTQEI